MDKIEQTLFVPFANAIVSSKPFIKYEGRILFIILPCTIFSEIKENEIPTDTRPKRLSGKMPDENTAE